MSTSQDPRPRKQMRRHIRRVPAAFQCGELNGTGYLKNVCKDGLFVRSDALPEPGGEIRLVFHDLLGSKVEITGVVRWTTNQLPDPSEARPGFGVHTPDPGDAFLTFYEQVLTN